jgi:hypothetical protein
MVTRQGLVRPGFPAATGCGLRALLRRGATSTWCFAKSRGADRPRDSCRVIRARRLGTVSTRSIPQGEVQ